MFRHADAPSVFAADLVRLEIVEWLPKLASKRRLDLGLLLAALELLPITWADVAVYERFEGEARRRMRQRDEADWPTVALALALGESRMTSIWSNDKDFSVSGLDAITTGDLLDALK